MADVIVAGVDGSPGSVRALAWALEEAAARGAVLEATTVWQSPYDVGSDVLFPVPEEKIEAETTARLDEVVAGVAGDGSSVDVRKLVLRGDAAATLCERSKQAAALVVGSRGYGGVTGALLGSVSMKCAHHSSCPVVIVPARHEDRADGRIVVGVDRSAGSRLALAWAVEEARARGWTVEVVEVWQDPYDGDMSIEYDLPHFRRERRRLVAAAEEDLEAFVRDTVGGDPPVELRAVLVGGEPAAALCAHHSRGPIAIVPAARPTAEKAVEEDKGAGVSPAGPAG